MAKRRLTSARWGERGSALVEGAIIIPVLLIILYWSSALTDIMVLKIKSSEAVRFALWETTVFRSGAQINADVAQRFPDLRSPASLNLNYTGLMLYPQAANVVWGATVNTAYRRVSIGGSAKIPPTNNWIMNAVNTVLGFLSRQVDAEMGREQFNVFGEASATATLVRASHVGSAILNGGDLIGHKHGDDLDHAHFMQNLTFQTPLPTERPMRLVFDTWKAWPKPAAFTTDGGPTNTNVSPMNSYPVVEDQVSAQVDKIVFFGLKRSNLFAAIDRAITGFTNNGVIQAILGGKVPDVFGTTRMDASNGPRGPITILPVEQPDVQWVPGNGLNVQRVGDMGTTGSAPVWLNSNEALTRDNGGEDFSRYTVPYRINSQYWTGDGGTDNETRNPMLQRPPRQVGTQSNAYIDTFRCRGHYFAGAVRDGVTAWHSRYRSGNCY